MNTETQNTSATVIAKQTIAQAKSKTFEYTHGTEKFMVNQFDVDVLDVVNHITKEQALATPQIALSQEITKRLEFKYSDVNFRLVGGRLNYYCNMGIIDKTMLDNGWRLWFQSENTDEVISAAEGSIGFVSSYDEMSNSLAEARAHLKAKSAKKTKVAAQVTTSKKQKQQKDSLESRAAALLGE